MERMNTRTSCHEFIDLLKCRVKQFSEDIISNIDLHRVSSQRTDVVQSYVDELPDNLETDSDVDVSSLFPPQPFPVPPQPSLIPSQPSLIPPHPSLVPPHPSLNPPLRSLVPPQPSLVPPQPSLVPPQPSLVPLQPSLVLTQPSLVLSLIHI